MKDHIHKKPTTPGISVNNLENNLDFALVSESSFNAIEERDSELVTSPFEKGFRFSTTNLFQ